MTRTIDIFDALVDIDYTYEPPSIGAIFTETGEAERLGAGVTITSIKCRGLEIISIIPEEQLLSMEQDILENMANQN